MLEFEVLGDRIIFNDFNRTRMEINARIVRSKGTFLSTHATEAANRDTPYFVNIPLSSLFSESTLSLNGEKNLLPTQILSTKVLLLSSFQKTWLACQGYSYEENQSAIDGNGRAYGA